MHFTKWQACGNDFVFINAAENPDIKSISDQAKLICDRHYGVGADGVIFILPSEAADLKMRIFNSDGSEAEMCGMAYGHLQNGLSNWAWSMKRKYL